MNYRTNPAFEAALRQLARPTTPGELERRGVTRLRAVKPSEIGMLIERAVNRTLMERTIGRLDEGEMERVLHDVEGQFKAQLRDYDDLADAQASIESHRSEMRTELARLQAEWGEPQSGRTRAEVFARAAELRRTLPAEIAEALALSSDGRLDDADRGVVQRLCALVESRIEAELAEQRRQFEVEIDIQTRRVAKLLRFLEHTEAVLARVAASKGLDDGLQSYYRSVQGLQPGAKHFELKQGMLARIFARNASRHEAG